MNKKDRPTGKWHTNDRQRKAALGSRPDKRQTNRTHGVNKVKPATGKK